MFGVSWRLSRLVAVCALSQRGKSDLSLLAQHPAITFCRASTIVLIFQKLSCSISVAS